MRTLNSAKNLASSLGITLIMTLLGFFTRKVFVDNVGVEYLGLNGLLQNILGIMTLLEGGFATSVVYNLYKPLAEDNRPKILALLQLYRKVYRYIALGIILFALCLYPFIDIFIKDGENLEYVSIVYFIFLFNSVVGYFTAYKWSLVNASQQNYKLTAINLVYQVGLNLAKLAILYYTRNYILYLIVEALFGVGLNICIIWKTNQLFPYIKTKEKYILDTETKNNIVTNMKALFINKIGGFFMHSTDNIIISAFVGVASIGLYSNYTLITMTVRSVVDQALNSFSESVGNLIASESSEKVYEVFKTTFFVNFLLASTPVIILHNAITPFISWWLGEEYLLGYTTLCVILFNFYIDVMRSTALTFKTKAGIFVKDRFTPLLQGIINLVLSYIFVQFWGLAGVLFATSISILSIGFWQFPRLCYKYVFHQSLWQYFRKYIFYSLAGGLALLLSFCFCEFFTWEYPLLQMAYNSIISLFVVLGIYYIFFHHTLQYAQLLVYVKNVISHRK
ncbi:MAG: hypothetical protein Q4A50_07860 [Bacteroidales bacterium]|nr:hypothetical protein [Bacteroidales bacterium]